MIDTYEVGNYVRRWARFVDRSGRAADPLVARCHVTDPCGRVSICNAGGGNVMRLDAGSYFWHMFAGRVGAWGVRWTCSGDLIALPEQMDCFEVKEAEPDLQPKTFPCLSDDKDLTLIPLAAEHLELLRTWRNRDDIRRWFFTSDVITEAAQRNWFYTTYLRDAGDLMWIAHYRGEPVGTGALTHVDLDKREGEWARLIIGEDKARGKGLAQRIAALVRDYGLDVLGLERICGSLYTDNQVTMHIDMSAGYMPYKVEGNITFVELLRKDWRK